MVATAYGGSPVLAVVPAEVPEPGPGEVTVRLYTAGVNPIDHKLYSGELGHDPARLPLRLGGEGAGVITAIGPGAGPGSDSGVRSDSRAGGFRIGDAVLVASRDPAVDLLGCYATAVTVPSSRVVAKPPSLDWDQAAGLLLCGVTAVHALAATRVAAGQTLLVHGVAGGVGQAVAQLAVLAGATVVGTAAPHHHARLRRAGIVPVTYGPGLSDRIRALGPILSRVAAAVDTAGTDEAIDTSLDLVDPDRVATVAAYTYGRARGVHVLGGLPGATDAGTALRARARSQLTELASQGRYRVPVAATFPLTDAAAAHDLVRSGHAGGKVVLRLTSSPTAH